MSTIPFKVKAVYDYSSPHEDDLSFSTGQIITVTEEEDSEWYVGEYIEENGSKKDGLFPRNFVEKYEPQAPPRPTRSRPKQDPQPSTEPPPAALEEEHAQTEAVINKSEEVVTYSEPATIKEEHPPAPKPQPAKQVGSAASKPPPPETTAKPTSNSFKDRIAAFNKPAAPPIAPKPSVPSGGQPFIKKPFVAPPLARNAYVPPPRAEVPQKTHKREEDPEVAERRLQDQKDAEGAGLPGAAEREEGEEAPKTTSLKDRIALLQKQQQEQAARRAESASKDKPKKPAKPKPEASTLHEEETEAKEDLATPEERSRLSSDISRPIPGRLTAPDDEPEDELRDVLSDGNEADQSGAGETTEDAGGDSTEVEESVDRAKPRPAVPFSGSSTVETRPPLSQAHQGDENEENKNAEEEEEEEMDPETRRKEELRARMAKMSGGMGMAGMFGMPPPKPPVKKQSGGSENRSPSEEARSPPRQRVPVVPMPGAPQRVQSPPTVSEDTPLVEKEPESSIRVSEDTPAEAVPDVEDLAPQRHEAARPQARQNSRQMSQGMFRFRGQITQAGRHYVKALLRAASNDPVVRHAHVDYDGSSDMLLVIEVLSRLYQININFRYFWR